MNTIDLALPYHAKTGFPLFFCNTMKRPTSPRGFYDASSTVQGIRELYNQHPGPLIAFPTGEASGIAVLDIDATKHPEAAEWYWHHADALKTLTISTRSDGWHCYFQHPPGLRCTTALQGIKGIDIRADAGYVISWGAHGYKTLTEAPVAPWPFWLLTSPEKRPERPPAPPRVPDDASIAKLLRWVADAGEGQRNSRLFWAGCRLADQVQHGTLNAAYAAALLEHAGTQAGLPKLEACRTAQSALSRRRV
ncbi:MAG: hypothetical protein B7Z76_15490 [Acidiphilium sp. 20-67-58]|uniref:bifunctional DNA primase/polymerase n=1 Tax=Acidiphilium sp. 20-67-58 TaxID=1970291 RepID=UPI000BD19C4C|nr:bifunctional DNA primase/polymerase [Acidiphilium sp. 20-67-58]OYV54163.1 MAG: hypothetical protein B7Z76_15490 [Acidiphilium sp. 20-67-58]